MKKSPIKPVRSFRQEEARFKVSRPRKHAVDISGKTIAATEYDHRAVETSKQSLRSP